MGDVVRFERQYRARLAEQRRSWRARRPPRRLRIAAWVRRLRLAPWAALLALVGFAAAASLTVDSGLVRIGDNFALCGGQLWERCVIDGDTIRYRGMTIRLADIDAPETRDAKCASEAALGRLATRRLLQLMNDGRFEVVLSDGDDRDIYGRKLRVIARDGRSLGDMLVAEGLARRWDGARRNWCG